MLQPERGTPWWNELVTEFMIDRFAYQLSTRGSFSVRLCSLAELRGLPPPGLGIIFGFVFQKRSSHGALNEPLVYMDADYAPAGTFPELGRRRMIAIDWDETEWFTAQGFLAAIDMRDYLATLDGVTPLGGICTRVFEWEGAELRHESADMAGVCRCYGLRGALLDELVTRFIEVLPGNVIEAG